MGDMDLATLLTLGLPMQDTLHTPDPSMEDILATMARGKLRLNQRQRLRLMLMLCTLPMDMDLATLPPLGLPMLDTLPTLDLSMEDTLPILDLSMEDTLPIPDLSMEDILATMARERLMLNQRLMLRLMLCTLPTDMDLATLPTLGLPMQDTLHTLDLSMEDTLPILDQPMEDTLEVSTKIDN